MREGRWFIRKSGEGIEGWGMGVGVGRYNGSVCVTLSPSQQLSLDLQGGPEPGPQEG